MQRKIDTINRVIWMTLTLLCISTTLQRSLLFSLPFCASSCQDKETSGRRKSPTGRELTRYLDGSEMDLQVKLLGSESCISNIAVSRGHVISGRKTEALPCLHFPPRNSHNMPAPDRLTALYSFRAFVIKRKNMEPPKVRHKNYQGVGKQAQFEKVKGDGFFFLSWRKNKYRGAVNNNFYYVKCYSTGEGDQLFSVVWEKGSRENVLRQQP